MTGGPGTRPWTLPSTALLARSADANVRGRPVV